MFRHCTHTDTKMERKTGGEVEIETKKRQKKIECCSKNTLKHTQTNKKKSLSSPIVFIISNVELFNFYFLYIWIYIYILAINTENGRKLTKLKKDENEREKWKRKQCETVVTNCWTVWQHIRKLANRFHSKDCFRILCSFCFLFITYPSYSFIFIIFIYCIFFSSFLFQRTLCAFY